MSVTDCAAPSGLMVEVHALNCSVRTPTMTVVPMKPMDRVMQGTVGTSVGNALETQLCVVIKRVPK